MRSFDPASLKPRIFDPPSLWDRVGGDLQLLREMLEIFVVEYPPLLAQLESAIDAGAPERVERASHKLKGSLLQFSAQVAAATAAQLEVMAKERSLAGADAIAQRLRREIDELLQAMNLVVSGGVSE